MAGPVAQQAPQPDVVSAVVQLGSMFLATMSDMWDEFRSLRDDRDWGRSFHQQQTWSGTDWGAEQGGNEQRRRRRSPSVYVPRGRPPSKNSTPPRRSKRSRPRTPPKQVSPTRPLRRPASTSPSQLRDSHVKLTAHGKEVVAKRRERREDSQSRSPSPAPVASGLGGPTLQTTRVHRPPAHTPRRHIAFVDGDTAEFL